MLKKTNCNKTNKIKMNLFYSCAIILSDKRCKGRENEKYNTE